MKNKTIFDMDQETSNFIKDVSTLFGIKTDVVQDLFNYMAFTWLLKISENPDKLNTLIIPYIGKLGIRYKKDFINNESGEMETELDAFIAINDSFKKIVSDLHDRDISTLTNFMKTNYIQKLLDN